MGRGRCLYRLRPDGRERCPGFNRRDQVHEWGLPSGAEEEKAARPEHSGWYRGHAARRESSITAQDRGVWLLLDLL